MWQEKNRHDVWKNALPVSAEFIKSKPLLLVDEIEIKLYQRYSDRIVKVRKNYGHYSIDYEWSSNTSPGCDRYSHDLTAYEACWLEKEVRDVIADSNKETGLSVVGTDRMTVTVKGEGITNVNYSGAPSRKYTDFMHKLEQLAQYGSKVEKEY